MKYPQIKDSSSVHLGRGGLYLWLTAFYAEGWSVLSKIVVQTLLGDLIINGEIYEDKSNVAYIPELFGALRPDKYIQDHITCSLRLPGYKDAKLSPYCKGSMLTWEAYGRCVAEALKAVQQKTTLIGSSKGAMVALYASILVPELIERVVVCKVPLFSPLRDAMKNKYSGISRRIVDEETFYAFLGRIRGKTHPDVMRVIEESGWENAKKLYEGASFSEMDVLTLKKVHLPTFLIEQKSYFDAFHPKKAFDLLYKNLDESITIKVHSVEEIFYEM
jgi:pimeloyl-ACP methyl ester carboxylesterase